jgi:transcriptional regulator with XRE-family HTH domain
MIRSIVAMNAKQIIKKKKLLQTAVAEKAGFDYRTFNSMLNGRKIITANDILPIAKALGVTPNDLFKTSQSKPA